MPGLKCSVISSGSCGLARTSAAHARDALGRGLGLGDADHVLERHAHREMPRRLAQQLGRAQCVHGIEPVEIERGVAAILIGGEAADALLHHVEARGRIGATRALDQVLDALRRRLPLAMLAHRLVELAAGMAAAEGEGREIGVDRLAGVPDRGLEGGVGNRQPARARQRAQQHGIDDAARFLGGLVHVEQDLFLAALLHARAAAGRRRSCRRPSPCARRSPARGASRRSGSCGRA